MKKLLLLAVTATLSCAVTAQQPVADTSSANYVISDSILIRARDGAQISALMVRKKGVTEKQTTILVFTIYARHTDIKKAKEAADKGYTGVVAFTRGKRYSPDEPIPYEHDGEDVYDVIDWIDHQPWSDHQVAMYGGSYTGFTSWASMKKLHPALKTIVASASCAPGLDVPMTNNVAMSFVFPWIYYTTNNKWLDEKDYRDTIWNRLYWRWYNEGRAYSALDTMIGRPNAIFRRWLAHPTYDKYWQHMIPYKEEFANINIPVLTTTGYYDGGQIGATYYLREHLRYNPKAEHYFIIGPYGHFGSQGYPDSVYNGYTIDPVAKIPIHDIIYEWFAHVFRKKPLPSILKDKINFQVMGSNEWAHVPSLEKMSTDTLKLYLDKTTKGNYLLNPQFPKKKGYAEQKVDFLDRNSVNSYYFMNSIIYDSLDTNNGLLFVSKPLQQETDISGRFSGLLNVIINKKDIDCSVVLFEQMSDGKYFFLSYFMGRASYATDVTKRQLLTPGIKQSIPFTNSYITARRLGKGSRIVALVNINKSAFEQINYGTGRDVSSESILDGKEPLLVKWLNDSYLQIPIRK